MTNQKKLEQYLVPEVPPPHPVESPEDFSLYLEARKVLAQTVGAEAVARATEAGKEIVTFDRPGRMAGFMIAIA